MSAQVELLLPNINNVTPGGTVIVPVQVVRFDSMAAAQFVIRWDSTVLRYKSLTNLSALGLTVGTNFNLNNALDSGMIRFQWVSTSSCPGTTLTDSTVIFKIRFDVIGPVLSGTTVKFASAYPTLFEITQAGDSCKTKSYSINQVKLHQGFVAVGYTATATREPDANPLHISITPNPFSNRAHVTFNLGNADDLHLTILDASGRVCYENVLNRLAAGPQSLDIENTWLQDKKGTYFLVLRAGAQVSVRPFLML
jgi:hypothetical protein